MDDDDPAVHNPVVHISTVDISLAMDSHKTIGAIQLKKNDQSLKNIRKTIRAGDVHHEEFSPPLTLDPGDHICVLANCSWSSMAWERVTDIPININLRDVECMRDEHEQGIRLYRKKERKIEVLLTGHESLHDRMNTSVGSELPATTIPLIQACSRFRLLIIGNSGVGKSSLIQKVFGVENIHVSDGARGTADIHREFISSTNDRFVVHDSLGFESGDERNMEIVKDFVTRRKAMPQLQDQLHAIWLCLETYSGGRLLEAGAEKFLQRRREILRDIPLVVVLTKVDRLDAQLELDLSDDETLEDSKSEYLCKHCTGPLQKEAGKDITHVAVSVEDGYSESLASLVKATEENMAKYHVDEAPRVVASIAQRVSIKEKIDASIIVGKKTYWKTLLRSAVFRGHTLKECLQVIRKDIITVWNFNDPDNCLMDDDIIINLLRTDNLGGPSDAPSGMASFATLLTSGMELMKGLAASGEVTLSIAAPIAGIVITLLQTVYEAYQEAKRDVKILMAFIVDLICVMQVIFLVASGDRVTHQTVALAVRAYETSRKVVRLLVDEFDGKLGILLGGRDLVLSKIEDLIWRHSIGDHEIERLRREIRQALSPGSS